MKVEVVHWVSKPIPSWLKRNADGSYDITPDDLLRLYGEDYDVMLTHSRVTDVPTICLDDSGRRFRQR